MLLVLIFASPLCDRVWLLRQMPHDHWLFATSTCLTAFVVFVGNPVSLYVSSSDFSGGIYGVTGTVIMYWVVVVLVLTALYMLVDETAQNALTLLSVFSAFVVVSYSMVGMKGAGVMSEFILPIPEALIRTRSEIIGEIAILLALFVAITYVTYHYRQSVTRVAGAMLAASLCAVTADVYGAKDDAVVVSNRLPVDHADIISFSQERKCPDSHARRISGRIYGENKERITRRTQRVRGIRMVSQHADNQFGHPGFDRHIGRRT